MKLVRALRLKQVIAQKGYITPHEVVHPLPEADVIRIAAAARKATIFV
ncbi:MAG: hypothetical protein QNJ46_17680 [Leptolyngbyaceae cyanobacterium MO_188.B28]|nr:hypothetical protein [Leptolyngbyaceae cyanobacterium MO_188.B28]